MDMKKKQFFGEKMKEPTLITKKIIEGNLESIHEHYILNGIIVMLVDGTFLLDGISLINYFNNLNPIIESLSKNSSQKYYGKVRITIEQLNNKNGNC